jgi:hypothetical protein
MLTSYKRYASLHIMIKYRPTPDQCAALLSEMMHAHGSLHGKAVTRARVSLKTLRRVCCRRALRDKFFEDLATSLLDWGWVFITGPNERYGLLAETSLEGWTRVTSASIADVLKKVRRGDFDFDVLEEKLDEDDVDDDAV